MWKRIRLLLWVGFAAFCMRACVLEPVKLTDDSMMPTLAEGDVAFVSKLRYGIRVPGAGAMLYEWAEPKVGDLVVAASVGEPTVTLLRRVASVPGEKAKLENGTVVELKPGEYFLLAEKKDGTLDSRRIGPVLRRTIIGKVTHRWTAKNPSSAATSQVDSSQPNRRTLQPVL
ncbi:MAG: signal peptidase I [Proteobacteria bacterium]|nr:MAG: signal peptidase I [Pseudomonadota bacterium]